LWDHGGLRRKKRTVVPDIVARELGLSGLGLELELSIFGCSRSWVSHLSEGKEPGYDRLEEDP